MVCLLLIMFALVFNIATSNGSNCPNPQWIEQSLEKIYVPGAAIIVVNATHVLYEQAVGHKSLSPREPIDIDKSIFSLASISKTFIGIAVMQLVEQELVDLDTDINQYLSEPQRRIFHPRYPSHSITLRKLLSHSASISINRQEEDTFFKSGDEAFNESLADMCFKYVNPNTSNWLPKPPGSVSLYSNQGSSLAALVVERIAKMSYSDYVEQKILKPIGIDITKTGVRLSDFENINDLVKSYAYAPNVVYFENYHRAMSQLNITQISDNFPTWLHISPFSLSGYPAGLWRMSARALSVYLRMFLNNGSSILRSQSIAEIRTVVGGGVIPLYNQWPASNTTIQRRLEYALSWYWVTASNGDRYFGHAGELPGMAHVMLVNKNNIGVIILSNADTNAPIDLTQEIWKTYENIYVSFFQCFDSDSIHASAFRAKGDLFGLFTAIALLFRFVIA
ncbi:hypothetical protein I4U23_010845 [Adineta vaga]|nr:hypothetical protein I4U23_010845 [Adineta vaga]